jgi:hypothetical protein
MDAGFVSLSTGVVLRTEIKDNLHTYCDIEKNERNHIPAEKMALCLYFLNPYTHIYSSYGLNVYSQRIAMQCSQFCLLKVARFERQ